LEGRPAKVKEEHRLPAELAKTFEEIVAVWARETPPDVDKQTKSQVTIQQDRKCRPKS
jgi:hypothetical protein